MYASCYYFPLSGEDFSESTSECSSLDVPHPEHTSENRNVDLSSLCVVEPLRINQSSLQIIGSSLSNSFAIDLKKSRGRKTLRLETFSQDPSLVVTPTEDTHFLRPTAVVSYCKVAKDMKPCSFLILFIAGTSPFFLK